MINFVKKQTMYAVAFDLDTSCLTNNYHNVSSTNAYGDVRKFMSSNGFTHQQGSVYFGDLDVINAVTCVTTIQKLAKQFPWFKSCVKDIRMLRIEDNNDLLPALDVL
jgi:virulence-associated protein VapD